MNLKSECKATGKVEIVMNGKVVRKIDNLVVTTGKEWIATMMNGSGATMTHMAIGVAGTPTTDEVARALTELVTEVDRNALTVSGGTVTANTILYSATWQDGDGNGALTEVGLFNDVSAGTMLARTIFDVVNKGDGDVMTIIWTITVA